MNVTVRLEGHLREFFPHLREPRVMTVADGLTVAEIIGLAGLAPELPGAVLCNRERVDRSHVPAEGDELVLLSPMSGG